MKKLKLNSQLVAHNSKKLSENEMIEKVSSALADEKAVGWMQGRMEFGPRALGGRSIMTPVRQSCKNNLT